MGLLGLFNRKPAESVFWQWFLQREPELFAMEFDERGQALLAETHAQLQRVHGDLACEFGMQIIDGKREFVISADGIKAAFPKVVSLAEQAPPLPRWTITRFRQRQASDKLPVLELGDARIDAGELEFSLGQVEGELAVVLFIPKLPQGDPRLTQIGFLMLDQALGEYDVATKLGPVQFVAFDQEHPLPRHPFHELPALFDQAVRLMAQKN